VAAPSAGAATSAAEFAVMHNGAAHLTGVVGWTLAGDDP